MRNKKPWSGRFLEPTNRLAERFNASISFDKRLYRWDILGSKAHAMALWKAGILTEREYKRITRALSIIEREIEKGRFTFTPDMEDIHMAIERRLIEKIGPLGGKLHTGRSRNDQIALDMRLYLKDEIRDILSLLHELKRAIVKVAKENMDCIMPGYTHMQRAQPVLLSHHMLAYYEMLKRDRARFEACLRRVDSMPLGSGALAGSPYNLDRYLVAEILGFSTVTENSLDGVSDRDFIVEFISCASILMMHLSRLCEELIIWSSQEFSFIELSDAFSTGSSIMPQKKNPDIPELVRGKTARVYGNLITLLTLMKALPLAYNKDMQEDKPPLFDTVDTVKDVLRVLTPMLMDMRINREAMADAVKKGFLTATDVADYLVRKGMPFRDAHRKVGAIVAHCIRKNITLEDLTLRDWRRFSTLFEEDILRAVSPEHSISTKTIYGGTALRRVKERIKRVEKEMKI